MLFVGIDWAEKQHDVCMMDDAGEDLESFRIVEGIKGIERLHSAIAEHSQEAGEVVVGIETDRGLLVGALTAAGYTLFAINPMSVDRYRDRHSTSGAKSDPGDAKVLADLVRTDRHNHRAVAGDTEPAQEIKVLARAHQSFIWDRQRQINRLRSALREFYPQALEAFGDRSLVYRGDRGPVDRAHARARQEAIALQDRKRPAPCGPVTKDRSQRREDPAGPAGPATGGRRGS